MLCSYQTETIAAIHEVLTVTGAREARLLDWDGGMREWLDDYIDHCEINY